MKVTFTIQDMADTFYDRLTTPEEAYKILSGYAKGDLKHKIKMRIGTGTMQDSIDFNMMMRKNVTMDFKIEPRKGYKLATFEVTRGI